MNLFGEKEKRKNETYQVKESTFVDNKQGSKRINSRPIVMWMSEMRDV
jgi:hypothetical protein